MRSAFNLQKKMFALLLDSKFGFLIQYFEKRNIIRQQPVGKASVKLADSDKVWLPNAKMTIK